MAEWKPDLQYVTELLQDFPDEEIEPTLDDLAETATALIKGQFVYFVHLGEIIDAEEGGSS